MNEYQKFEAKDVQEAILKACSEYGKDEEQLEVEVLENGSSGIFGLGGKNAVIQARPKINEQALRDLISDILGKLLQGIVPDPELEIQVNGSKALAVIKDEENSGLIIGKEGQTISALEFLANRILAKHWPEKVYLQLDAGGYKEKQEESVRQNALYLARKVKRSGKPLSTRPMSSYHRRLVHLALQEDQELVTRSTGEGSMKRVLIACRRNKSQEGLSSADSE
ncbi:MAG: protein jag [Desulfohalobiaceae bacterium]